MKAWRETVSKRSSFVATCCVALLFAIGCNQQPQRVPVAGTVLIDGEPLSTGTIRFVPDTGRPVSAHLGSDGSFRVTTKVPTSHGDEVEGLYPGRYKLAVFASENVSSAENAEVRWLAPQRYADFRTAGLEASIQGPSEDMVVELTSERPDSQQDSEESEDSATEESGLDSSGKKEVGP